MRAVSLVRYWLYGFRGFVAMTISLAIAFSWAVTGPPTNTELDLVGDAVATRAEAFGEEIEAATIQLCPSLPEEVRMLCAGAPAPTPVEEAPIETPPKPPPARAELAATDVEAPLARADESQLLGAPAPRARRERAQASVRATPQRAAQSRRTVQRIRPQPRTPTPRPVAAPVSRQPQPTPAVRRSDGVERLQAERERAADDFRREADERRYREQEAAEHEDWRQERRERREQRRRRWEERQREAAADEGYYEEDRYREEAEYPDEIW